MADDDFADKLWRELAFRDRDRLRESIRNGDLDGVFGAKPQPKPKPIETRVTTDDIMARWRKRL